MTHQDRIKLRTTGHGDMSNITPDVSRIVAASGILAGVVHVFNVGSTGAVCTIECEPGLTHDLPDMLDELMPPGRDYAHEQTWHDGNGHSHLQATSLGASVMVPIQDGQLVLGTWQQIVHLECDTKARKREVMVTVMGE